MSNFNDDIEIHSDDCYNEDSDKEYFDESHNSDEENSDDKIQTRKFNACIYFQKKIKKYDKFIF